MSGVENKLTEGSIVRNLVMFGLPFVGSFLLRIPGKIRK